jgi:hypothetical protein
MKASYMIVSLYINFCKSKFVKKKKYNQELKKLKTFVKNSDIFAGDRKKIYSKIKKELI